MKIEYIIKGSEIEAAIEGRLDTVTAPDFDTFVTEKVSNNSILTIDCQGLEYVSSAGLRVLLSAHKKTKGSMKLKNVCEIVMEVFEMTGFADILVIE